VTIRDTTPIPHNGFVRRSVAEFKSFSIADAGWHLEEMTTIDAS